MSTLIPGHNSESPPQDSKSTNGIKPEQLEDRIIFVSIYNDIDWSQGEENFKRVSWTVHKSWLTHTDAQRDICLSSDQELKKRGVERTRVSPKVSGTAYQKSSNYYVGPRILEK